MILISNARISALIKANWMAWPSLPTFLTVAFETEQLECENVDGFLCIRDQITEVMDDLVMLLMVSCSIFH